jgi:hypothetical protein
MSPMDMSQSKQKCVPLKPPIPLNLQVIVKNPHQQEAVVPKEETMLNVPTIPGPTESVSESMSRTMPEKVMKEDNVARLNSSETLTKEATSQNATMGIIIPSSGFHAKHQTESTSLGAPTSLESGLFMLQQAAAAFETQKAPVPSLSEFSTDNDRHSEEHQQKTTEPDISCEQALTQPPLPAETSSVSQPPKEPARATAVPTESYTNTGTAEPMVQRRQ